MRLPFADSERLKREAKKSVNSGLARIRRWWVGKYKLPPSHELFQNQSLAELTQEMYEDLFFKKAELEDILENDDRENRENILEQLNVLNKALGEEYIVSDPLVAQWEKDLEEGRIPDLDAKVPRSD